MPQVFAVALAWLLWPLRLEQLDLPSSMPWMPELEQVHALLLACQQNVPVFLGCPAFPALQVSWMHSLAQISCHLPQAWQVQAG